MAKLITDLISFDGDKEIVLLWDNFTNPVSRILRHLLSRTHETQEWRNGITYRNLEGLLVSEIADVPHVGEIRSAQVVEELTTVFRAFEDEGAGGSIGAFFGFEVESGSQPDLIDQAESLAEVVSGILEAFNDYRQIDQRTLDILRGRNPAFLRTPRTLDDIAIDHNVTRERIRQIEGKYSNLHLMPSKIQNRCLDDIIKVLETSENEDVFISRTERMGLLSDEPVSLRKLQALLTICELDEYASRVDLVRDAWDRASEAQGSWAEFARSCRNKFGLIDLAYFKAQTGTSDIQAFDAIRTEYPRSIMKGNLVLARTNSLDTTYENIIGKQLLVFGELEAENLLVGIERHSNYRQVSLLGSQSEQVALIKEIAGTLPNYETYIADARERPELSDTDTWLLEQFQDSPTGMLHRNEITAASIRDGRNVNSMGVFLLFNPLIRPVGVAVMSLANTVIDPDFARKYASIAKAAEDKTHLEYSFQGDQILLSIRPNLNTVAAGVLFPSPDLSAMIKEIIFAVRCSCNGLESTQQLRLRPPNFWTGFTAAIKHAMNAHHFSKNDEFRILLDFDGPTATVLAT